MDLTNNTKHAIKTALAPWMVCFAASLFFFYECIQGNMFASIADSIMYDFHIQADKMTYMSSSYYVSNVLFLFIAGFVLDRFSTKKTLVVAMLLCVLSTFALARVDSYTLALYCRFIAGIGSAFCFLGPVRIASHWFPPKRMAMVTGVIVTIAMVGGMLAQYPLTKLVIAMGWRNSLQIVGWLGVAMLLMMIFWIEDRPPHQAPPSTAIPLSVRATAKKAYLNAQAWCAAMYTSLMNMAVAVFGAMMGSLYLMERLDISKETASLINSMLFLGAIVGGPFIGWCSDRLGLRVLPMKIAGVLSLVTMMLILYAPISSIVMGVLFFLLGFFTAGQVISYALVAESSATTMTASALSLISVLTQGGYVVYQVAFSALLTYVGKATIVVGVPTYALHDYQVAAVLLPIGLCIALGMVMKLKETHCRHV